MSWLLSRFGADDQRLSSSADPPPQQNRYQSVMRCSETRGASTGPVLLLEVEIGLDGLPDPAELFFGRAPGDSARDAEDEGVWRDLHSFADDGAGADDRPGSDVRSVQEDRAHRDQHIILDRRTVHDRAVAYPDPFADYDRQVFVDVD